MMSIAGVFGVGGTALIMAGAFIGLCGRRKTLQWAQAALVAGVVFELAALALYVCL